jgi:hypothetical protein
MRSSRGGVVVVSGALVYNGVIEHVSGQLYTVSVRIANRIDGERTI